MGRQRHCARRNRSLDGHAARPRRRSAGSGAVQPRPSVRRADRRRPAARSDRCRNRRQVGRDHPPEGDRQRLPGRRPLVVRAGQHPLELLGLVLEAGLREGRRARAEELGRVRRGGAEAQGSRHHSVRHRRRRQWLADPAALPGHGDRGARRREARRDVHQEERRDRRRPRDERRVRRSCARSSSSPTRAMPTATGTTRPISSSPTRRRCRSWATGRAASSRRPA